MFVPHGEQTHERWDLGRGEEGVGDWLWSCDVDCGYQVFRLWSG